VIRSAQTVQAPDGRMWVVRRRWVPRLGAESLWGRMHRRFRQAVRRAGNIADADPGCLEVLGEGIAVAAAVIVIVVFAVFVGLPVLFALLDLIVVLLLALLGVLARVLFRRPWVVEARANDGAMSSWRVVGWTASRERCTEIAQLLAAGIPTPEG
jgi:hypothetical protein